MEEFLSGGPVEAPVAEAVADAVASTVSSKPGWCSVCKCFISLCGILWCGVIIFEIYWNIFKKRG